MGGIAETEKEDESRKKKGKKEDETDYRNDQTCAQC